MRNLAFLLALSLLPSFGNAAERDRDGKDRTMLYIHRILADNRKIKDEAAIIAEAAISLIKALEKEQPLSEGGKKRVNKLKSLLVTQGYVLNFEDEKTSSGEDSFVTDSSSDIETPALTSRTSPATARTSPTGNSASEGSFTGDSDY